MNSLKKVAVISGIVFAVTLLLSIVLTPFAVSGTVEIYNGFIDAAQEQKNDFEFVTTVDSSVKELTLAESGYYSEIVIQESPDNQIHIRNQDLGFSYITPKLDIRGSKAELNFIWINDPKLTEENIIQWFAAELSNYRGETVIQLPASASLYFADEQMYDLFHNVRLEYTGFANYDELQSLLDAWNTQQKSRDVYANYLYTVNDTLNSIRQQRYDLAEFSSNIDLVDAFQIHSAEQYASIKEQRSNLLKQSYNLRKEYGTRSAEELEAAYLEMNNVIVELCDLEKQYDLLSAKVSEARQNLNNGNLNLNAQKFEQISNDCYDKQVELDLEISRLREQFEAYLMEEIA